MNRPVSVPPAPPRLANRARGRRPPIGLTPLIDVVFILLVFFMLATSFVDWRSIDLDAPARAVSGGSMEGALLVEVRKDGLRLSGEPVAMGALAAKVRERLSRKPDRKVLVKPAAGVALQDTVSVLDRLAAAGVANLSVIRDRPK